MPVIKMTPDQWATYARKLGKRYEGAARRGALSGALASLPILHDATRTAVPASTNGHIGAFDTGAYLRAWKAAQTSTGARIYNALRYSPVVEYGRRAGAAMPPSKALVPWVRRVMGVSAKEAKGVAFVVARAIARRGLRPRRVMTGVLDRIVEVAKREIMMELERELRRP